MTHIPVLEKEVLKYLDPKPNENFIDGTIGEGGHAIEILKRNGPNGLLLGIDLDYRQIDNSRSNTAQFFKRIIMVNDSYLGIKDIVTKENFHPVNGILLDLGMSSWQVEESNRGFTFKKNEFLDMRYNLQNVLTAEKIINEYPEQELIKILKDYGQEHFARQIAKRICKERKKRQIQSTFQLKDIISLSVPPRFRHGAINYATRTFQALRIAVNGELENIKKVLPVAFQSLTIGGRLVVISFHSLEDRLVKNFFKEKEKEELVKILTKKPVVASLKEVSKNPRSRSAKLRAIIKV